LPSVPLTFPGATASIKDGKKAVTFFVTGLKGQFFLPENALPITERWLMF
jgi:hypothetical protein